MAQHDARAHAHTSPPPPQLFVNEYDLGMRNNFQQVFGKGRFWFSWMLPTTRKPAGSGLRFPTCRDLGGYGIVGSEHHV